MGLSLGSFIKSQLAQNVTLKFDEMILIKNLYISKKNWLFYKHKVCIFPLSDSKPQLVPEVRVLRELKEFPVKLAVCVAAFHFYVDWVQLVQSLEIWRAVGAEKVYFYMISIHNVSNEVISIIKKISSKNVRSMNF